MKLKDFEYLEKHLLDKHSDGENISISIDEFSKLKNSITDTNESLYKDIFEDVPCTISVVNSSLEYTRVNNTLAKLCHLDASEFIGKKIGFYTENKFFLSFTRKLFESDQNSISQEIKTTINHVDKIFWVSANKINNDSEAVLIGVDITDLKLLEGQVQFNEKLTALGEMVAGIVHDIKNPLTVISTSAQQLKKVERLNEEKILKISERVSSTSERILKIVNSIKVFVRSGEEDPFVDENLLSILEEARDICNHKFHEHSISFEVVNPEESFKRSMNVTKIFQVFVNLLSNACDELSEKNYEYPWVKVEFVPELSQVKVRDCGGGISESVQEKIFESFFTTKGVGVGSGLGLSNCKRIMNEHDGDIFIEYEDKFTCFVIQFSEK
jgi:signal transduction histidine kinase